jgi:hypothetical protein
MSQNWKKPGWQQKPVHAAGSVVDPPPARADEEEQIGGSLLGSAEDEALSKDEYAPVYRKREPTILEKTGHAAKALGFGALVAGGIYYGGRALLRAVF